MATAISQNEIVAEPIQMKPTAASALPPADVDDPDSYMIFGPAKFRKLPIIQMLAAALALILAVAALSVDQMSDGDVHFSIPHDGLNEIDYDCGWKEFRFQFINSGSNSDSNFQYNSAVIKIDYTDSRCKTWDVEDTDFCEQSAMNGKIWLSTGILGIVAVAASIPIVYFRGKDTIIYPILVGGALFFFFFASFNWLLNEKCRNIENWDEQWGIHEQMTFETGIGPSLALIWTALFCCIVGLLVSSLHLWKKYGHRFTNDNGGVRLSQNAIN